jgi:hypothetical protein
MLTSREREDGGRGAGIGRSILTASGPVDAGPVGSGIVARVETGIARAQRVLATLAFTLIGVSAVDVIALLVLRAAGVPNASFQTGGLLVLQLLPLPGLTIGLLLVVALFVVLAVRRSREQGAQRGRR